jgi:hypothetical protein
MMSANRLIIDRAWRVPASLAEPSVIVTPSAIKASASRIRNRIEKLFANRRQPVDVPASPLVSVTGQ